MSKRGKVRLAITAALMCACVDLSPCEPGQMYEYNACYPVESPDGSAGGDAGAPMDAASAGDAGDAGDAGEQDAGPSDNFGMTCTMSSECVGASPHCVISPGNPDGYCTATGCNEDPKVCAEGWTCFDLAALGADQDISSFCRRPR